MKGTKSIPASLLALALAHLSMAPSPAAAHGTIHDQIASLTARIEKASGDAALYLRRADLHREDRSWDAALADYERASRLDPELHAVHLARAEMLLEAEWPDSALVSIDRFLLAKPRHSRGRATRGRILAKLGRQLEAAEELEKAIALVDPAAKPDPDDYLDRARCFDAAGRPDEALRGLDEGIARLGPLASLQLLAIELERAGGRFDAALSRVETLARLSSRREAWWVMRGEILLQAGRTGEARRAFDKALAAIDTLPASHRWTRRTLELQSKARAGLTFGSDPSTLEPGPLEGGRP